MKNARSRIDQLIYRQQSGEKLEFIFFFGHKKDDNTGVFSQWYNSPFNYEGVSYHTAEHYMMARKALLFNDKETLWKIWKTKDPLEAKVLGRQVKGFSQEVWDKHAFDIVVEGNVRKFLSSYRLKEIIISTGQKILVEASPYDKIWGIGIEAPNHPKTWKGKVLDDVDFNKGLNDHAVVDLTDVRNWKGYNMLGFALMAARHKIVSDNLVGNDL
jgi:ribA/ribD-fused uncharacterized protein